MLDVTKALESCFAELSKEYDIEKVDEVPYVNLGKRVCAPSWRILVPASTKGKAEDVEMYIAFPCAFPYVMPWVFVPDDAYRYYPHISFKSRKLCLFEDGIVYDERDISDIIRINIRKARQWVEKYSDCDCTDEYAEEIVSYWSAHYNGEEQVDDSPVMFGEIPDQSCSIQGFAYPVKRQANKTVEPQLVFYITKGTRGIDYIKENHKTIEIEALFLASVTIPMNPPCSMTVLDLTGYIKEATDRKLFRQLVNKNKKCYVLFSIGSNHILGGVFIDKVRLKRSGFSRPMTPFEVHGMFENKNRKLERFMVYQYDTNRIVERTAGEMMKEKKFTVAGMGSIGSNLCYYLNGYNNAQFALVDNDFLTTDNIGRHLLGYEYLNQSKVLAVKKYFQSYRPDREVNAINSVIEQISSDKINEGDALFICIGDEMIERWVLEKVANHDIKVPLFILWLEPYAISGIMIYVNPDDEPAIAKLITKAKDSFFDYCLVDKEEYEKGDKLTQRDAGCNGMYSLYSANDVTMYLSAMFPHIDTLLSVSDRSKCYQWIGNLEIAKQRNIRLTRRAEGLKKNNFVEMSI